MVFCVYLYYNYLKFMDTKFQTSFIPKKPIIDTPGSSYQRAASVNVISVVANIIFAITLVVTGGAFLYKNFLINQVKEAGVELEAARSAFETEKIQDLLDVSKRFSATKNILENHIVVSELLILLQTSTVKTMSFNNFSYQNKNKEITLTMIAEAQSFNAIAQQADIFSKTNFIKDINFSNFVLSDNGMIKMSFSAMVSPELISYKKVIESLSLNQ